MNRLSNEDRTKIIAALCEGMSIRAIERMLGYTKKAITKLLVDAGVACSEYQDKAFRNLSCRRIQADEIWAFCYAKARNELRWRPRHDAASTLAATVAAARERGVV